MSHGLGKMQRAIMDALLPSKRLHRDGNLDYRGGSLGYRHRYNIRPHSIHHGKNVELPDGCFDIRAVKELLTRAFGEVSRQYVARYESPGALNAAFSRAVRSLVKRGLLEKWNTHYRDAFSAYPTELPEIRFVRCPGGAPTAVTMPELESAIRFSETRLSLVSVL
jgi:hypothetical protein